MITCQKFRAIIGQFLETHMLVVLGKHEAGPVWYSLSVCGVPLGCTFYNKTTSVDRPQMEAGEGVLVVEWEGVPSQVRLTYQATSLPTCGRVRTLSQQWFTFHSTRTGGGCRSEVVHLHHWSWGLIKSHPSFDSLDASDTYRNNCDTRNFVDSLHLQLVLLILVARSGARLKGMLV